MFSKEKYEIKGKKFANLVNEWSNEYTSAMSIEQKCFLMEIINDKKMQNVLEIGVFMGVTSVCILKSGLSVNNKFQLYGIDNNNDKIIGSAVNGLCTDKEKEHYHLYAGYDIFDIENITPQNIKFDLVIIDAGHSHPFPLFDLIFSIPYMHNDTIIILHDVIDYMRPNAWGESFIFEAWTYEKYRVYDYDNNMFSNMGCIKLHNDNIQLLRNIELIAKIPLRANPWAVNINYNGIKNISDKADRNFGLGFSLIEIDNLSKYMDKHYSAEFSKNICEILTTNYNKYMNNCFLYIQETRFFNYLFEANIYNQNKINNFENRINILENKFNDIKIKNKKLNDLIDKIAWWIPVRKWRDNFRNKFFDKFIEGGVNNGFKFLYPLCFRLGLN